MSETSPATPSMATVTFRIRDDLPPVCVICGEAATGQSSQSVPISADTTGTALSLLQLVSGFFGIFLRQRTSPRKTPDHKYVRLPHCTKHNSPDNLRAADTDQFLNDMETSNVQTADDFLRKLKDE